MKKEYIVKQHDLRDCGVSSLLSIIKYYKGYLPIETLRLDTHTNNDGTTAYNLVKTGIKYGFDSYGLKLESKDLKNIILPAIANITLKNGMNHYVVIYKVLKTSIVIMDPLKGFKKLNINDFLELWNNVVLIYKPREKIALIDKSPNISKLFVNTITKEKYLFIRITITSILLTILSIITSFYLKIAISTIDNNTKKLTYLIILIFLIIYIFKVLVTNIKNIYEIYLNKNIDTRIMLPFIKHIFKLPLNVIKNRSSGEIITRVNELNNIKTLFTEIFITIFLESLLSIASMYILFIINNKLFFILCIIVLLYLIISLLYSKPIYNKINDGIDSQTEFNSHLIENIENIETIKNLNLIDKVIQSIEELNIKYLKKFFQLDLFMNVEIFIQNFINEIGLFIISSYGIIMILNNKMTLIDLVTFNTLLSFFIEPIKNMINLIPKYNLIKVSFNKISEFNELKEEISGNKEKFINGDINLINLSYSYNTYNYILNKINITINKYDHVLLIGKSGSGKSTICKLLMRYDNYEGNITIAGVNISDYNLNTIRDNITYVSQNEKLFTKTIRENITLNNDYSIDKINEIINICELNEILDKKPLRLETLLVDGGLNLSGGEKQRIILARSLLRDKDILILDEALNEIEEEREKRIIKNIHKYCNNKTIIYISHRDHQKLFKKIINIGDLNE